MPALAVGTRVRLLVDHLPGRAGEEGIVTGGPDGFGDLTVQITNRADCTPITRLLLGVPPGNLDTNTHC